jgi:hypothetical protein
MTTWFFFAGKSLLFYLGYHNDTKTEESGCLGRVSGGTVIPSYKFRKPVQRLSFFWEQIAWQWGIEMESSNIQATTTTTKTEESGCLGRVSGGTVIPSYKLTTPVQQLSFFWEQIAWQWGIEMDPSTI